MVKPTGDDESLVGFFITFIAVKYLTRVPA